MSGVAEPALRKIQRLQRELVAARKALRKIQWLWDDRANEPICPSCEGRKSRGHERTCQLAAALRPTRELKG